MFVRRLCSHTRLTILRGDVEGGGEQANWNRLRQLIYTGSGTSVSVPKRWIEGAKTFLSKHVHTKVRYLDVTFVIYQNDSSAHCGSNCISKIWRPVSHLPQLLIRIFILFTALNGKPLRFIATLVDAHVWNNNDGDSYEPDADKH